MLPHLAFTIIRNVFSNRVLIQHNRPIAAKEPFALVATK